MHGPLLGFGADHRGLGQLASCLALVTVRDLLHEPDTAHGHEVPIQGVAVRAFDGQVVDAENQLGIGQGIRGLDRLLRRGDLSLLREVLGCALLRECLGALKSQGLCLRDNPGSYPECGSQHAHAATACEKESRHAFVSNAIDRSCCHAVQGSNGAPAKQTRWISALGEARRAPKLCGLTLDHRLVQ
ncbi:hypothetical protein D9M68_543960 [compost metagenome]